jgi:hypothetical protein
MPQVTNMLVTSDGVQMPSKSRDIAAVPELMGLKATVVSINNTTHSYLCGGCANNHLADVRIAFEDFNMEFYIDNDFIIAVEMKISKIKPREPSSNFGRRKIEIVPQDINGIHRLAQFLLNRFVKKRSFESTLKENLNSSMKFFKTISIKIWT